MSLARLVITAVTVEGRIKTSVAREYGITRFWVQTLVKRFEVEGEGAFEPHSRRPHTNPRAVDLEVEDQIVRLRKTLTKEGLDAGAETIAAHLATTGVAPVPAVSTIWRILSRRGFVVAQPQKRPRSSWKTFCADQPNERWQADITHWRLADGTEVEILNILDDHSRVNIAAKARRVTLGAERSFALLEAQLPVLEHGDVVLVSHEAVNRALLTHLDPALDSTPRQRTGCWNEIRRNHARWTVSLVDQRPEHAMDSPEDGR
jgi:transposase